MNQFNQVGLKEKLKNVQSAFKSFDTIELKGRKHIQEAIIGCYDIYLHYNPKLIKKRCKNAGIKYKVKKPMKMILMLAMGVSDDCDDERIKARIRTYVRVLKRFKELDYEIEEAQTELNKFGIDYFANPRSKELSEEEETEDDEKQLESDDDDDGDDDDDDGDDEEDPETVADVNRATSKSKNQSLGAKTVKFFQANNIKDKNYVIWVEGDEVYKSTDTTLLKRRDDFDFIKLK